VRRLALLAAALLVLTGCSTVPTSSPTVQITQAPTRPDDDVGIEPLRPEPGATPEEIVRGFVDAAASTVRGHPVAREHLTPDAARSWSDEGGITILGRDYATFVTDSGTVTVTAGVVGTVDPNGVFTVGGTEPFSRQFTLQRVDGEWRIADPPDGLLMLQPDFERLYDDVTAYFLDPTGQRLVPEPRYLITGDAQPTSLVDRELDGPSPALAAGVRNPLSGAELRRAITLDGQTVTVDLTNVEPDPSPGLSELCAQLVWTLNQFSARSVEILIDGEPVQLDGIPAVQTVDDWQQYDPDGAVVDAVGHYLSGGALFTVAGTAAPGPAGAGQYRLTGAAVSADPRTGKLTWMAGTAGAPDGAALLTGPYGGELTPVVTATSLTAPTVAATRAEIWVVRDGDEVVRIPSGAAPQAVNAPTLPGLGTARVLQLSPDGVRAAVVIDGPTGPALYVGTVARSQDGAVALRDLRAIAPSLSQVADVAWRDGSTLVVLAGDAGQDRTVLYTVGVDGWGLDDLPTAGLPGQPDSVAAAPSRRPLVSAGGTIWEFSGGTWLTLIRGAEPLPGSRPFYPL
jgi:Lipoprotein LpqB beta-propeller domain/Sporulation and spore germination